MTTNHVSMVADLAQDDQGLRIAWSATNSSAESLLICVRANIDDTILPTPYTYLTHRGAHFAVTLRTIPMPPHISYYKADLAYYRWLEAGQSLHETCHVPIPALELHPYGNRPYPTDTSRVEVAAVDFSVEYFLQSDLYFARKVVGHPELFRARAKRSFLLEKRFPLERPITILKRNDDFYRYE